MFFPHNLLCKNCSLTIIQRCILCYVPDLNDVIEEWIIVVFLREHNESKCSANWKCEVNNWVSVVKDVMMGKSHPFAGLDRSLRVPGGWGSQFSRQLAHEGGKVVSPTHRLPLPPQEIFLVLISVRGCQPQNHNVGRRIISIRNSNDTIRNQESNPSSF